MEEQKKFVVAIDRRHWQPKIRAGVPFDVEYLKRDLVEEMIIPGDELHNVSTHRKGIQCYHVYLDGKDTGAVVWVRSENIWEFWRNEQ